MCRLTCARRCTAAPCLRGAGRYPAALPRIRGGTEGVPPLPGGTSRRLRGLERDCSSAALRYQFLLVQLFRGRFAVQNAITEDNGLKFYGHLRDGFRVAEKQVAARLERLEKALNEG